MGELEISMRHFSHHPLEDLRLAIKTEETKEGILSQCMNARGYVSRESCLLLFLFGTTIDPISRVIYDELLNECFNLYLTSVDRDELRIGCWWDFFG